jgi:erythromycin esterase-like protein
MPAEAATAWALSGTAADYEPLLDRARDARFIGHRPETERFSHYFAARLADQFDAVIHVDETRALHPLERTSEWEAGELPETYPSAV